MLQDWATGCNGRDWVWKLSKKLNSTYSKGINFNTWINLYKERHNSRSEQIYIVCMKIAEQGRKTLLCFAVRIYVYALKYGKSPIVENTFPLAPTRCRQWRCYISEQKRAKKGRRFTNPSFYSECLHRPVGAQSPQNA